MAEISSGLSSSSAHMDKLLTERAQRRLEKRRRRRAREQGVQAEVGPSTLLSMVSPARVTRPRYYYRHQNVLVLIRTSVLLNPA